MQAGNDAFYLDNKKHLPILDKFAKKLKSAKAPFVNEIALTEYDHKFSEAYLPKFIKNMQEKNLPLVVFTRNTSGNINEIEHLEIWTFEYLKHSGIDLSLSPLGNERIIFNKFHDKIKGSYPTFYRGLLSTSSDNEGKNTPHNVLASLFLNRLKFPLDTIFIVSTQKGFIEVIETMFREYIQDIKVVGFIYQPTKPQNKELPFSEIDRFWNDFVKKINNMARSEKTEELENPYEE